MIKKRTARQRLCTLLEMLNCNGTHYLSTSGLTSCSPQLSDDIAPLLSIFQDSGCEDYLWSSVRQGKKAVILWSKYNLFWIGTQSDYEDAENELLVLGPLLSKEANKDSLTKQLGQLESVSLKIRLCHLLTSLPRASYDAAYRYASFLAYCVRGEKIPVAQIDFQQNDTSNSLEDHSGPIQPHEGDNLFLSLIYDCVKKGLVPDVEIINSPFVGLSVSQAALSSAQINAIMVTGIALKAAMDAGLMPARAFQVAEKRLSLMLGEGATPADTSSKLDITLRELAEMVYGLRHRADAADPIVQCMAYIDAHPDADIDLELLAAQAHYSKYYLTRKFKERTGQSIVDYIQKAKIDRAQILLRTTHMSLSEIASALSLSSASYLDQLVKKHTGQTAAQYRKTCREQA